MQIIRTLLPHQLQESAHYRHRVADLMGYAGSHLPDQRKALDIIELAADFLLFSKILNNHDNPAGHA
ncbi:hypothetical protein D3C75_1343740 [compost metagenome]